VGSALYRRYRPETFAEVIGQAHVTDPLRQALASDRTNHAYLFSGPRGCGKTTSARILARCLNCAEGPTDTPCGTCSSCVELARDGGGSLDVVEIDAASHNGVDDARELRERAVFAPSRDRYKIYILDEAHMVTQQGFNALLKIVEEPPDHVKFIFATTEPEKVLQTIRSRTHHYPFRLVAPAELIAYLESVCETEGVGVEPGVLSLVVRSGGGSVRDSLSILDQLMAGSTSGTLTLEDARTLLGYTATAVLDDVVTAIADGDNAKVFSLVDKVVHSGQDPRRFVEDFLAHLRDLIVVGASQGTDASLFPGANATDIARMGDQAARFSPAQLTRMADIASHALKDMAGVTSPKLQLEVMMAKITYFVTAAPAGGPVSAAPSGAAAPARATAPSAPVPAASAATPPATQDASAPSTASPVPAEAAATQDTIEPMSPWNLEAVLGKWPAIIESLAESKRSLWVALAPTIPTALDGDVVTIGFARKSDAEILRKPQGPGSPLPNADLLRDVIYAHTGHRVRFTVGVRDDGGVGVSAQAAAPSWPVVSLPGSDDDGAEPEVMVSPSEAETEPREAEVEEDKPTAPTSLLGQRGEPAIRQVLGGELIGEEILDVPVKDAEDV
jgi:DNA polymerase III subunit gamma/tau